MRRLPKRLQQSVLQQTESADLASHTHTFMLYIGDLAASESGMLDRPTRLMLESAVSRPPADLDILSSDSDLIVESSEEMTMSSEEILSGFERSGRSSCDESSLPGVSVKMPCVLQDVFRDLMLNSRKYSEASTIKGLITNVPLSGGSEELLILVEDEGIGFKDEGELQDAIKMYHTSDRPEVQNRRSFGKGFGLTKAYYTVKQYNGTFKVNTLRGGKNHGTRMEIRIPLPPVRVL
ncbi:hypothetical protein KIPB_004851 [Kipferlia bialata]|uniref:Histidine kinase domain-containing protein n=1 Tax=Kipferlia bialata TaxID=797122 RepID=A0A9K3CW34_9EUKA|nr:hypothetical protein KIPB_004851 [Kipferlia bialata]|eukprot:g4851.t1